MDGDYSKQQQPQQQPPEPQQLNYPPPGYYPPGAQQGQQQPPAAAYPAYPLQQPPVAIMQQPTVQVVTVAAPVISFRDAPLSMQCPHCQVAIVTRLQPENGLLVWLVVGAICMFGAPLFLFLGCCLIPLCIQSLKDIGHYCPGCNRKLGTYQRVR